MKYLKTKYEKDSATVTTLIVTAILALFIFVRGCSHMDPPIEYGVAVNFGNTDFGQGDNQPQVPVKSEQTEINEPPQPDVVEPEPTQVEEAQQEEVLTQDTEEALEIKKQKEAEAKAKAEAERIEKERIAEEERKKREAEEKKRKLDALIGGVAKSDGETTGSEGDDNKVGDKGQLDGNPYAPSYFGAGSGSGGVGYGLNGRGKAEYRTYKQQCNESGLVIVKIVVNRSGDVIEAIPGVKGTTNTSQCLLDPAKKVAMSHKWRLDTKAPTKQVGFVKVNFTLGQ